VFRSWNIIDAGLYAGSSGHHFWETKALADELLRRGVDVRVFSHKKAPIERFPGVRVYPTFSLFFYMHVSNDPSWGAIENFVVHNRRFAYDMMQVERSLFSGPLNYFSNLSEQQFLGAIRWLASFDDVARPKAVVTLVPFKDWSDGSLSASNFRTIWAGCPAAVKNVIVLTVRAAVSADRFDRLLGVRPHVLPSALVPQERRAEIASNVGAPQSGPMIVSFVGGARRERGTDLLPDLVNLCAPMDVRFFIQVKGEGAPGVDLRGLAALRELPNVELYAGVLERNAYYDAIARSVVLIPYDPDNYSWQFSGVYADAKFLGAPVIVSAGSWVAEEVISLGNGLVFEEYTPAAIVACIARAQREIGPLRERAAIVAREFSAKNGADRCVDAIESVASAMDAAPQHASRARTTL
jgi:glycosyltransferase involved in cell wall biosynthesis